MEFLKNVLDILRVPKMFAKVKQIIHNYIRDYIELFEDSSSKHDRFLNVDY